MNDKNKPKLLLHICCAPCGGFLAFELLKDFTVTVYYGNSNIYPEAEFKKRLAEARNFFTKNEMDFMEAEYNHNHWLSLVAGLENEPERGKRCILCYYNRLRSSAEYAKKNNFDCFGSTLAISPHKDALVINNLGRALAKQIGIPFLAGDWKKQDGFRKAMEFSHEHNFYRQNYCGCEFTLWNRAMPKFLL